MMECSSKDSPRLYRAGMMGPEIQLLLATLSGSDHGNTGEDVLVEVAGAVLLRI